MEKRMALGLLLALMVALSACASGNETGPAEGTASTLNEEYPNAISVSSQIAIGTLTLEGTPQAVTKEQAQDLLPLWQMLQALQQSGTAAQAEIYAVVSQIQAAMTPDQLATIKDMRLTSESMQDILQEQRASRQESGGSTGAGTGPGGGTGVGRGSGSGDLTSLSPDERATMVAERSSKAGDTFRIGFIIRLLEERAGAD